MPKETWFSRRVFGSCPVEPSIYLSDALNFPVKMDQVEKIVAADKLDIFGLSRRNRDAGLGVPFIAVTGKTAKLPIKRSSPGTLFLRINGNIQGLETETLQGSLELYAPFDRTHVEIDGKSVPLESDLSAQLAYNLNQPVLWELDITSFFMGKSPIPTGLYFIKPYNPAQIPVIFVHGTASSPVWWAEMANTLLADPILRKALPVLVLFLRQRQGYRPFGPTVPRSLDADGVRIGS